MTILFLSHTSKTGVFRVGSHHLARHLALRGHTVVHATTPVTPGHLALLMDAGIRRRIGSALRGPRFDEDGVAHIVMHAPWSLRSHILPLRRAAAQAAVRALSGSLREAQVPEPDLVLIDKPALEPLIDHLNATVIYRATDSHDNDASASAVHRLMTKVDAVVATSQIVLESLGPQAHAIPSLVLANGVDCDDFRAVGTSAGTGAAYVGAIDYRFDWAAIISMAERCGQERIRLAGPVSCSPPPLPSNVELLGPMEYRETPALMRSSRVGLLPFNDQATNRGRSPMKYFEYLAAGLYVVGSRTPTLTAQRAPGVGLYETATEAGDVLSEYVALRGRNEAGVAFAKRFDWVGRAATLEDFLRTL